jgi:hypothetical protein
MSSTKKDCESDSSESESETIPCAQKCARCGRYLLQNQSIVPDPKRKNWYSHHKCVYLYVQRKTIRYNQLKSQTQSS